jgi:hypothetical protein
MHQLSEQQIKFIQKDIQNRGIEIKDLQLNLLDHICCLIEENYNEELDFESFYEKTISSFYKNNLKEIEEETILLLTYKNYYAMKKTMLVSGATAVFFLLAGSLFKIMHWPGAGIMLVMGVSFICFLFMPLLLLTKNRETTTLRDKVVMSLGTLVGILYCLSTLFKVQHWPGASYLWFATIIISAFVFIPIYFFTGIRNPETKTNTIVTSILLVGATSILFMLMNLRPSKKELELKMYSYLQSEEILNKLKLIQSSKPAISNENKVLLDEINASCEQIKKLIFESSIGKENISKNFDSTKILLEDRSLGTEFSDDKREGSKLIAHLKQLVNQYNASASVKIPEAQSILNDEFGNIGNHNVYLVLNSLVQLQMHAAGIGV